MSDLQKPQEAWTRLLGHELGSGYLALLSELAELERRYSLERTQAVVLDLQGVVGPKGIALRGVALGRNTAPDGSLWATLDAQRVRLFRESGQRGLVAEGPDAFAEVAGSGLSGRWDRVAGAPTVRDLRLLVVPDWLARVDSIWTGEEAKDRDARRLYADVIAFVAERLREARQGVADALRDWAQLRGAEFLGAPVLEVFAERVVRDPSGAVTRPQAGFLVEVASAMRAESKAGPQSVSARQVTAEPARFAAGNRGRGTLLPFQPSEGCPAARWTFRCVRGAEQGLGGQEEFRGSATLESGETLVCEGLRVGFPYVGPRGFGPLRLERSPSKTGDPTDALLGPLKGLQLGGESSQNTDSGVLHWRVSKGPAGTYAVDFSMSLAFGSGDLVARAEGISPSAPFRASERNVSGLWVVWALGPAPRDGAQGTLNLHFFRADGTPDAFVVETRVRSAGAFQALLAHETGGALPSSAAPTIPDGFARAGVLSSLLIGGEE